MSGTASTKAQGAIFDCIVARSGSIVRYKDPVGIPMRDQVMSQLGHLRQFLPVSGMSAFPPIATEQATWLDVGQGPISDIVTSVITGRGLGCSYPSPSDRRPRRDWNETSPPPISASGRVRCRATGDATHCAGASLSVAAGTLDRWLCSGRCSRPLRALDGSIAIRGAWPAIRHREPNRCRHEYCD